MLSNFVELFVLSVLAFSTNVFAAPSTPTTGGLAHRGYTPTRVEGKAILARNILQNRIDARALARNGGAGNPAPSQGGS